MSQKMRHGSDAADDINWSSTMSDKLAIEGGPKTRSSYLPYGSQQVLDSDIEAVTDSLRQSIITRGKKVQEFEEAIALESGAKFAVAFNSGTSALHAAMAMFEVSEKKKVLVPAITFAASANSARYCGGQVDFVDIRRDTLNLDENQLQKFQDIDLLVAVDFAGNPCDYDLIRQKLPKDTPIISDAAHSLGAKYRSRPSGSLGDVSVFSFHPVKSITSAEGGAVVVNSEEQYEFLRRFRNHGIGPEERPGFYKQDFLGFNYHMTELQAALGVSQIKRLDSLIQQRQETADSYMHELKDIEELELPQLTPGAESAWHLFPVRLRLEKLKVDRDQILEALRAENIGCQVHYIPVYWHPYYASLGFQKAYCPVAESEYSREISLPIFPGLSPSDRLDVKTALQKVLQKWRIKAA